MLFAQPFPHRSRRIVRVWPPPVSDWIKSIRPARQRVGERLRRLLQRRRSLRRAARALRCRASAPRAYRATRSPATSARPAIRWSAAESRLSRPTVPVIPSAARQVAPDADDAVLPGGEQAAAVGRERERVAPARHGRGTRAGAPRLRRSQSFTCPSSPAEASSRSLPAAKASAVTRPSCALNERCRREDEVDHSRTVPPALPLATVRPPGAMPSALGRSPCPRQVRARPRVSVRHSLMLRSWPAAARSPARARRSPARRRPGPRTRPAAPSARAMSKSATAPAWLAATNWLRIAGEGQRRDRRLLVLEDARASRRAPGPTARRRRPCGRSARAAGRRRERWRRLRRARWCAPARPIPRSKP